MSLSYRPSEVRRLERSTLPEGAELPVDDSLIALAGNEEDLPCGPSSCRPLEVAWHPDRPRCRHPNCRRCWARGVRNLRQHLEYRRAVSETLGVGPPLVCFERSVRPVSCLSRKKGRKPGRTARSIAAAASAEMDKAFAEASHGAESWDTDGAWMAHWFTGEDAELEIVPHTVTLRETFHTQSDGDEGEIAEGIGSGWTVWSGGMTLGPPDFFDPPPPIADPGVAAELHLALKPPGKKERLTWRAWGSLQASRVRKLDWGRQSREPWTPSHDAKILGSSTSVLPAGYCESSHHTDAERQFQPMFDGI